MHVAAPFSPIVVFVLFSASLYIFVVFAEFIFFSKSAYSLDSLLDVNRTIHFELNSAVAIKLRDCFLLWRPTQSSILTLSLRPQWKCHRHKERKHKCGGNPHSQRMLCGPQVDHIWFFQLSLWTVRKCRSAIHFDHLTCYWAGRQLSAKAVRTAAVGSVFTSKIPGATMQLWSAQACDVLVFMYRRFYLQMESATICCYLHPSQFQH